MHASSSSRHPDLFQRRGQQPKGGENVSQAAAQEIQGGVCAYLFIDQTTKSVGNKDDRTLNADRRRSVLFGGSFVVLITMAIDTIGTIGTVDAVDAISTIHGSLGSPVGRSVGLRCPSGVQRVVMKQLLCTLAQLGRVKELPDALHVADVVSKSHQPGLVKPLLAQPCGPAVSGINRRPCLITALCQVMDKDDARGTLLAMLHSIYDASKACYIYILDIGILGLGQESQALGERFGDAARYAIGTIACLATTQ